jgi:hypothetical protein
MNGTTRGENQRERLQKHLQQSSNVNLRLSRSNTDNIEERKPRVPITRTGTSGMLLIFSLTICINYQRFSFLSKISR